VTGTVRRLAVIAVLALAGCAGVPDSGPVRVGRPVAAAGGGLADAIVREVPAAPQPGAGPVEVVGGFLRAMVDSDSGYGVARSYLTPGASWAADSGIDVYAEPVRLSRSGKDTVVVRAHRLGVLGPHGVYRVAPGPITRRFHVVRRNGEWRIAKLSPGVLLSADDAGRVLQPAAVYFLTPDGQRVVPQPVLEPPLEPGLATTLMRGLLAGPSPLLAAGVRTAVPRGTSLVGNVPISADGVAEVDLSAGTREITAPQLMRLSAQVVWTLRQLSSVTAVRLLANGTPLEAPGVSSLQLVPSWPQFDPAMPPTASGAYAVRAGHVVGLGARVPPGLRGAGMVAATRSADGKVAAAVRDVGGRDQLLVGRPGEDRLRIRLEAGSITPPSFGPDGRVIVATSNGTVHAVPPVGAVQRVALAAPLRHREIRALAMSRDGSRVALVVSTAAGSELDLATVVPSGSALAFRAPRVVIPATSDVSGVAWAEADELVTTVSAPNGRRSVVRVGTNGYQVDDLSGPGLPASPDQVAAAPGARLLAASVAGTWRLNGSRWRKVSTARVPYYAGG
jgi:hypothetical protein